VAYRRDVAGGGVRAAAARLHEAQEGEAQGKWTLCFDSLLFLFSVAPCGQMCVWSQTADLGPPSS
jgi:hypothetical protein